MSDEKIKVAIELIDKTTRQMDSVKKKLIGDTNEIKNKTEKSTGKMKVGWNEAKGATLGLFHVTC